jgi:hypothetical protein
MPRTIGMGWVRTARLGGYAQPVLGVKPTHYLRGRSRVVEIASFRMEHGPKRLTAKNWLQLDPTVANFVDFDPATGVEFPFDPGEWTALFLKPQLHDGVPENVRALFEVARSALPYGCFYYPLWAHAQDNLYRVGEAALSARFEMVPGHPSNRSMSNRREWLVKQGVLTGEAAEWWKWATELRNLGSHRVQALNLPPGLLVNNLLVLVEHINDLFDPPT